MADRIITVTNPSVVTNDTLASYNNYSDIDGLLGSMTIGEAAAGKTVSLSDGVTHVITTKPVGTTNGEFTSIVSNAVTVDLDSFIFSDRFDGNTINLSKWNIINPDASVVFSQNDELICSASGAAASDPISSNGLRSVVAQCNLDAYPKILTFDLQNDLQNRWWRVGLWKNADLTVTDDVMYFSRNSATKIALTIKQGGSVVDNGIVDYDASVKRAMKLVITSTKCQFFYWSGSAWVSLSSHTHAAIFSGDFYVGITQDDSTADSGASVMTIDNLVLTDEDFATERP